MYHNNYYHSSISKCLKPEQVTRKGIATRYSDTRL